MEYSHSFILALERLERSIAVSEADIPETLEEVVRAGVIQTFEVAYEQSWKLIKRFLENDLGSHYVDGVARRELFRLAAEHHLIVDAVKWMKFHEARNKSSHTYNSVTAHDVFDVAKEFAEEGIPLAVMAEMLADFASVTPEFREIITRTGTELQ